MKTMRHLILLLLVVSTVICNAKTELKIESNWINRGEELNYKATWGFLNIGSATTKVNKELYKVGSNVCYKVDIIGKTNGLASLYQVNNGWTSYIDTSTVTTHKSIRRIREGKFELDEQIRFDHQNKKAIVEFYVKNSKHYPDRKHFDTPENIRDVIAGFLVFQLIDLSAYKAGEEFTVNGFYDDEGYSIPVKYIGSEFVKTEKGKVLCYKVIPIIPKNNVFKGSNGIEVWLSKKSHNIVRISAKMFVGHVIIDQI